MEEEIKDNKQEIENITETKETVIVDLKIKNPVDSSDKKEDVVEDSENEVLQTDKKIENITEFISSIKNAVEVREERDKYKDEAIQRMTKQIASFEKGIFETIKKELIFEIISFYDLLLKFQEKFHTLENKEFQNEIDFLETELSNILFNNSIDEIDVNIGDEIDRDIHKIKQKIETNNLEENQKIIKILKKGFIWNEKVIRKQEVIIAEYKKQIDE